MSHTNPDDLPIMRLTRYLTREVEETLRRYGRYLDPDLIDQARRAVHSVALNTAEAVSLRSPGKKAYHFELARGSAGELVRALARLIAFFRSRT